VTQARRDKGPLQWAKACIAADIRDGRTTLVLAEASRGKVRGKSVDADDEAFRAARASGVPVVAALPVRRSLIRWLETPLSSPAKALRVLPSVLDVQLPFPLEGCVYAFLDTRQTPEKKTRSLAVATRLSDAEQCLAAAAQFELDPAALDHEGLAVWTHALEEFPPEPGSRRPRAVLHLEPDGAVLVLGKGPEVQAAHGVSANEPGQIARLLKAQLGEAGPDGSSAREPMDWIWCGAGAADEVTFAAVREPIERVWPGDSRVVSDPDTFLAQALAARALAAGPLRCNLRAGPLAHAATRHRARASSLRAAVAVLVSGLALCAASLAVTAMCSAAVARADATFAEHRDRLLGYRLNVKGKDALERVAAKLDQDGVRYRPFVDALRPSLTRTLTAVMNTAREDGLQFKQLSLDREQAVISGTAADWDACNQLVETLAAAGYAVKLDRKDALEDERVPFTIEPEAAYD
jgi:hypothetical protein